MVVERIQHGDLRLGSRTVHVRMELAVGGFGRVELVAGVAVLHDHGPELVREAPRTQTVAVRRLDLLDLALEVLLVGDRPLRVDGRAVVLVAARAAHALAGHAHRPAAHQLERAPFAVERLEGDRGVGRHLEADAAVLLDVHRAEDALDVPAGLHAVEARHGVSARLVVVEVVGEHAQLLRRAARHAREAGAVVDVGDVHGAGLLPLHAAVGDDRRTLPRGERDRLGVDALGVFRDERHVVERVHEVDAHESVRRGLRVHEMVLRAERPRIAEVRLAARELVLHERVAHVAVHVLAVAGELVHEARLLLRVDLRHHAHGEREVGRPLAVGRVERERIGARERGVAQAEAPQLAAAVVSAREHRDEMRLARHAARVREERRRIGARAPQRELAHAVRVHRHQLAREEVREVRILPAREHHAPVVRDGGREVAVLLERELAHLARLAVHAVEHAHRVVAVLARQELPRRRPQHDHLVLVRQVAGVPPLDVVVAIFRRNKFRLKIKSGFAL